MNRHGAAAEQRRADRRRSPWLSPELTAKKLEQQDCAEFHQPEAEAQLEKLSSSEDCTSLFSLEYFSLMVNSLPADRILHIMLGSDLPVKIDADLAVDEVTGAQGNVKFLLAPRIDRD